MLPVGFYRPSPIWLAVLRFLGAPFDKPLFALEQEGFVERLPGKGTVVRDRENAGSASQLAVFAIVLPEIQSATIQALVDALRIRCSQATSPDLGLHHWQ